MTTNDLVDLMREFGVEVRMLGTDESPDPASNALCAMLTEIHEHRTRIADERVPAIPEGWYLVHIHRHNGGYRAVLDNTLDIESKKVGTGPTWHDALTDAIQKAEEADRE